MNQINEPVRLMAVQCNRCKKVMHLHPGHDANSEYLSNCRLHNTQPIEIDHVRLFSQSIAGQILNNEEAKKYYVRILAYASLYIADALEDQERYKK